MSTVNPLLALIVKNVLVYFRERKFITASILFPLLLSSFVLVNHIILGEVDSIIGEIQSETEIPLTLPTSVSHELVYSVSNPAHEKHAKAILDTMNSPVGVIRRTQFESASDIDAYLFNATTDDVFGGVIFDHIDVTNRVFNLTLLYNSTDSQSLPTLMQYVSQAVQSVSTNRMMDIKLNAKMKIMPLFGLTASLFAKTGPFMISIALVLTMTAFAQFAVIEREKQLKQHLLLSSVSLPMYWLSRFVVDYVIYLVIAAVQLGMFFAGGVPAFANNSFVVVLALYLLFGGVIITAAYCTSFVFKKAETANRWLGTAVSVSSSALFIIVSFIFENNIPTAAHYTLALIPSYSLYYGMIVLTQAVLADDSVTLASVFRMESHGSHIAVLLLILCIQIVLFSSILLIIETISYLRKRPQKHETPTTVFGNILPITLPNISLEQLPNAIRELRNQQPASTYANMSDDDEASDDSVHEGIGDHVIGGELYSDDEATENTLDGVAHFDVESNTERQLKEKGKQISTAAIGETSTQRANRSRSGSRNSRNNINVTGDLNGGELTDLRIPIESLTALNSEAAVADSSSMPAVIDQVSGTTILLPTTSRKMPPVKKGLYVRRGLIRKKRELDMFGQDEAQAYEYMSQITGNDDEDVDVLAERQRLTAAAPNTLTDTLRVINLRKKYNTGTRNEKIAVDSFCLGVNAGEIFGLLGPNGAGKTTLISALCGELGVTSGEAYIDSLDLFTNRKQAYRSLGVCAQFDRLWDHLTGREHLTLYARLRGVANVKSSVQSYLDQFQLTEFADHRVSTYSGGTKRKLSVALAFVGSPRVVFLDEPTTGMDPATRRNIWQIIHRSRTEHAIVLTTHSMEEADAICSRIGIMVNGKLVCLGTAQHLKSKYGGGYRLSVTTPAEDANAVYTWVTDMFPDSKLLNAVGGAQHFEIRFSQPEHSIAATFKALEQNRQQLRIIDYSISQTTLEQVFLHFARSQLE